jgi:hypothetical protein
MVGSPLHVSLWMEENIAHFLSKEPVQSKGVVVFIASEE